MVDVGRISHRLKFKFKYEIYKEIYQKFRKFRKFKFKVVTFVDLLASLLTPRKPLHMLQHMLMSLIPCWPCRCIYNHSKASCFCYI